MVNFTWSSAYIPEYNIVDGFWLGVKLKTGVKLSESSTLRFVPSFYYTTARKLDWTRRTDIGLCSPEPWLFISFRRSSVR